MSFIPPTYGESASTFRLAGTTTYGVVVLGHSFGVGTPSAVDAANAVRDSWEAAGAAALLSTDWFLDGVRMAINDGGVIVTGEDTRAILDGTGAANGVEPNTSILVTKSTDQGGRGGRGRMYMPGAQDDSINQAGVVDGAYRSAYQGIMDDFLDDLNANEVPMRLLHAEAGPDPAVVLGLTVQSIAATQRRRLRR